MKRTNYFTGLLAVAAGLALTVSAGVNDCIDYLTYGNWVCNQPGNTNSLGTLNYTNATICVGSSLTAPSFSSNPTFAGGQKKQVIHHSAYGPTCSPYDETVYQTVNYLASGLYFVKTNAGWPNLPGPFTNAGTYYYTAKYDGIAVGGVCGDITGIVAGTIKITVTNSLPVIISQPTNQTVCPGASASLAVSATGASPLVYEWRHGTNILTGQTNSTLSLTNIYSGNAGTYTINVTNQYGGVSASASLTVSTNVTVSGPLDLSVPLGSNATISVTAFGTGPISYQWKFGTNVLAGKTNSTLTITAVNSTNVGTYSVVVSGACSSVTKSAYLQIMALSQQPLNQVVTYGQSATFSVTSTGAETFTYQWRKNGTNIPWANSRSYTVITPQVSDSGAQYSVVVTGPNATLTSSNALLTVSPAPLLAIADNVSRPYGSKNPVFASSLVGLVNGDTSSAVTGSPLLTTSAGTNSNAGAYAIQVNLGTLAAANYALIASNGVLSITPAALEIVAGNPSREYGATNPVLPWSAVGLVNGQGTNVLSGAPVLAVGAATNSPVGRYAISITQGSLSNANYALSFTPGLLSVVQAPLGVRADDKSRATGTTNPVFTGVITGRRNNDNVSVAYGTSANVWSPAGTYPIVPELIDPDGRLNNYVVFITNGTLSVSNGAPNYRSLPTTGTRLVNLGATLSLSATVAGATPMTFKWKKNGADISESNVHGKTTSLLTISNFVAANAGSYTLVASNSLGSVTTPPTILTNSGFGNNCDLYPIGVPTSLITSNIGSRIVLAPDLNNPAGAFLWLDWNGGSQSAGELEASLAIPGNSSTFVNSRDSNDRVISINDWISGDTGTSISDSVKTAMSALTNYCTMNYVELPVWYNNPQGGGQGGEFQFYSYAKVKIVGYQFQGGNKTITIDYYGSTQCEPTAFYFSKAQTNYVENAAPVILDPAASVSDFSLGTLTVSVVSNNLPEDVLSITNQGTQTGQISLSGTNVYYSFTNSTPALIGSYSGGVGTNPLMVVFNSENTISSTRALVQRLAYSNTSEDPSTATRTVSAVLAHAGVANVQTATIDVTVTPVNDAPIVWITNLAPTNQFFGGLPIAIAATATDVDSEIASVRFFGNGTQISGPVSQAGGNYSIVWTNAPLGTNTVYAVASDGLITVTSTPPKVVIVLDNPPTVTITRPQNDSMVNARARIVLQSIAEDDGVVVKVNYFTNGVFARSVSNSPYPLTLGNLVSGPYIFQAVAYDNRGQTGMSAFVTNFVAKVLPQVQITYPASDATFAVGGNIPIQAVAWDADGVLTNVQFSVGGTPLGAIMTSVASNVFTWTWTNAVVANPTNITVKVWDNDGQTNSALVPIFVDDDCPAAGVLQIQLSPNEVFGGGVVAGMVVLSTNATTGGQTVTLSSSHMGISFPPFVHVPAGTNSVTFTLETLPTAVVTQAVVTASYRSTAASNSLSINSLVSGSEAAATYCGPMDVVFVLDQSSSMGNSLSSIAQSLSGNLNIIEAASGGDYRVGLVSFSTLGSNGDEWVFVKQGLTTNTASVIQALQDLNVYGGDDYPEASDEALNTVIHALAATSRNQTGDFSPAFRPEARKIVILVTDDLPGGFYDNYNEAVQSDIAMLVSSAVQSNIYISTIKVGVASGGDSQEVNNQVMDIMANYAYSTGGVYVQNPTNDNAGAAIQSILSQCGGAEGGVVFVRDDSTYTYASSTVIGPATGGASTNLAVFDTRGVFGSVTDARIERNGRVAASSGSRYDVELGIASTNGTASSFGLLYANAQNLGSFPYGAAWDLPNSMIPIIQAQLDGACALRLTNHVSSICGDSYAITDHPQFGWPTNNTKNILTFVSKMDRMIPAGRCRSFVLTGTNSPLNGTWDIVFRDRIVGSSGRPNGWDVESDYTVFGGFTVTVPQTATVEQGYEVRVRLPGWPEAKSARFQVLPANSIASAPVLLPLLFSTNSLGASGGTNYLTVALDTVAPVGDAYVTLWATGPGEENVPAWVVIPAGHQSVTTNIVVGSGSPDTLIVTASYNGERVAKMRREGSCSSSSSIQNFTVTATEGTMVLNWNVLPGATSYSLIRSNAAGTALTSLFTGLTATNFIDTDVVPLNTYYYWVTAYSNACNVGSAQGSAYLPHSGPTPAPWIIPFGGVFHDRAVVLLTNYLAGTTNFYTTNGQPPTMESSSVLNWGTLIFSNSVTLKAFATNANYDNTSRVVSAAFTIVPPTPLACGQTTNASLTTGAPWSTADGPGYYSVRFALTNSAAGENVDVRVTSGDFDTVAYLFDPSGRLVAANDDLAPTNTNSRLQFTLGTNGVHMVEVTSYDQQEVGAFNITLACAALPAIHAYTNGVELANYDVLDLGLVTNATRQVSLVLSNLGLEMLNVTSIKAYPSNVFGVSASSLPGISAGGTNGLTLSFTNDFSGIWTGLLVLTNDTPGENPFYLNLRAEGIPPSGPPSVTLAFPTDGTVLPGTNWNIELYATAYDADGITNVAFYRTNGGVFTLLGSVTNAPYTNMWPNVDAGAYQLVAKAWDAKGFTSTSSVVSITVGTPTLVLSPTNACVGLSNTQFAVQATLKDPSGTPLVGSNVTFSVQGAHPVVAHNATTVAGGVATFTYTGINAGTDRVTATATVNGSVIVAMAIQKPWAKPVLPGSTNIGTLATDDGYGIGCQCVSPTRYSDFYSITNTTGSALPLTLTMTATNFSTYLFVLNTNCTPQPLTNEALNATDVQAQFTVPAGGIYIIEATSADVFQTGGYKLVVGTNSSAPLPEIAVLSPTNVPSDTLLDMGTTNTVATLSRAITITNRGGANLVLNNHFFTIPSVFSLTPAPTDMTLVPGAATNLTLQFSSAANGQFTGSLVITNNDADENPFVLNLTAIANPEGTAPIVGMTTPTNNSRFVLPGAIEIAASVIPVGTGVTITNVEFVYQNAQGAFLIGTDKIYPYTAAWVPPLPGGYTLFAVAKDSEGRTAIATNPVYVVVNPSSQNQPPRATNDTPAVLPNSVNNLIDPLTNDRDPDGDALTIISVTTPGSGAPRPVIVNNGKAVTYTPPRNMQGADYFYYDVTDGKGGTARAQVAVGIVGAPMPKVEITDPESEIVTVANGTTVPITATITNNPFITSVEFYQNGVLLGVVTNATSGTNWVLNWSALVGVCDCGISATGIDKFGQMGTSGEVTIYVTNGSSALPVARLDNLVGEVQQLVPPPKPQYFTNLPTVRDGLFDVLGAAYTRNSYPGKAWQLVLADSEGEPIRNLTPGPLDATGFRDGEIGSATTTNVLATCDFTTLRNGVYEMILRTKGDHVVAEKRVRFRLESELKIGQFTFSEQDMVIPVNGIPLTVVRTYDSMNPTKGDFGYSWTYAINDMEIELYDERKPANDIISDEEFSLRVGGWRDVTLTLPGGRRATFAFSWEPTQCGSGQWGSYCLEPKFISPPGMPGVNLRVMGDHIFNALTGRWQKDAQMSPEWYEFPGYILTLEDGTEFHIQRDKVDDFFVDGGTVGDLSATPYGPPYLAKIVQRSGDTIEIGREEYDNAGNPGFRIQHRNALGNPTRAVVFQRDAEGRIAAITDPIGQASSGAPPSVKYEYDAGGNLSKVLKLVNRTTGSYLTNQYFYENGTFPHYLTRIVDARGTAVTRNLYDATGKLIGMIDANGRTNRFEHDLTNRREIQYDRSGQPTVYQYDPRGNVLSVMNPLGHTNGFVYDADGHLTSKADGLGNTTTFVNDGLGNVLSVTLPHPAGADPAAYTTSFTYDSYGNQTSVRTATGATITNIYDGSGNLVSVMNENGVISSTAYNSVGLPVQETDTFGSLGYKYDALGNLTDMTNSLNQVTTSGYDANGNLTNLVDGASTSSVQYDALNRETGANYGNGITVNYGHDGSGEGDWSTVSGPTLGNMERKLDNQGRLSGWQTANNASPGFAYDVNGRMEYETNSIGVVTHTSYDAAGRVVAVTNLTTGGGSAFGYDAANRRVTVANALGHQTGVSYNADGSLATMTNELGRVWTYAYETGGACCGGGSTTGTVTDPLGRQVTSLNSSHGLPVSTVWRSGANVSSNYIEYLTDMSAQEAIEYPVVITDEGARTRRYGYTTSGQLAWATDLSGATWWTNQFDAATGSLTNVVSPTGENLTYAYDERQNILNIRFGDGNSLTNFYNAENRLNGARLPSGTLLTNFYDFAGRLTNQQVKLNGVTTETASFEFNLNDVVTVMSDNTGSTTNVFDAAGRLQGINYPSGASVRYGLDLLGRIASVTNKATAGGAAYVTRYAYGATGSVTNVIDPFNGVTALEYDSVGRRTKRILPNNVVTEWQYDWRDRVTNLVHKTTTGTVLASFGYTRNAGGEPSKIVREGGTNYVVLAYDAALRLTNEVYYINAVNGSGGTAETTNSYGYDASGSRTRWVNGSQTLTNSVSGGYQITQVKNGVSVVDQFAYDTGGRVTLLSNAVRNLKVTYNAADQVASVTNGGAWVSYVHDASGRRTVSTNSASVVRRFLVAPTVGSDLESPQLIANASGAVQAGYVYLGNDPILRYDTSGVPVYYLEDAMGSVAALANAGGSKIASFNYDGFGNLRSATGTTNAPTGTGGDFRFHGAWFEEGSGLYNMRAREYDARMGRFTSRDPRNCIFRRPETFNPYPYAMNNAYVYIDPSGQFSLIEINLTTAMEVVQKFFEGYAGKKGREKLLKMVGKAIKDQIVQQLKNIFPVPDMSSDWTKGIEFSEMISEFICDNLHAPDGLYLEVPVAEDGTPKANGFNCKPGINKKDLMEYVRWGIPRPDFIIGQKPPLSEDNEPNKTWVVGEFKSTLAGLYREYKQPGGTKIPQFNAAVQYAAKHTYSHIALFICAIPGKNDVPSEKIVKAEILKHGVTQHAVPVVVIMFD